MIKRTSFLGLNNSSIKRGVSFLSKSKPVKLKSFTSNKPARINMMPGLSNTGLRPYPAFRKESIRSKRLSPYGDADLDGSPNKFDCSPRNVAKDGFFNDAFQTVKKYAKDLYPTFTSSRAGIKQRSKINTMKNQLPELKDKQEKQRLNLEKREKRYSRIEDQIERYQNDRSKLSVDDPKYDQLTRRLNDLNEEAQYAGALKGSAQAALAKTEKKYIKTGRLLASGQESLSQENQKNIKRVVTALVKGLPGIPSSFESKSQSYSSPGTPTGQVGRRPGPTSKYAAWGGVVNYRKWASEQRRIRQARGLPVRNIGLSRTLNTPEEVAAAQREYLASRTQSAADYATATALEQQPQEVPVQVPNDVEGSQTSYQQTMPSEKTPMQKLQAALQNQMMVQQEQRNLQMQRSISYRQDGPNGLNAASTAPSLVKMMPRDVQPSTQMETALPRQMADMQRLQELQQQLSGDPNAMRKLLQAKAQMEDNVLRAPQFMKGELKNVGDENSMTFTPADQNILNAPNAFTGELRKVNNTGDVHEVQVGPPPVTNPYGEEYLDIDLATGRQVLKKRKSEKWLTVGDEYSFATARQREGVL